MPIDAILLLRTKVRKMAGVTHNLPAIARVAATLSALFPDIGQGLSKAVQDEFALLQVRSHQLRASTCVSGLLQSQLSWWTTCITYVT